MSRLLSIEVDGLIQMLRKSETRRFRKWQSLLTLPHLWVPTFTQDGEAHIAGQLARASASVKVPSWDGFAAAKALRTFPGLDFYFTILDSEAGLGRISQVQLFTIKEEWSLLKLRTVVELAKEVYSVKAQDGETLETFETPAIAKGVYILITNYESPLGEVEHGFKVELYR